MVMIISGVHQSIEFLNYGNAPLMCIWYRTVEQPQLRQNLILEGFTPRFYVLGDKRGIQNDLIKDAYFDKKLKKDLWGNRVTRIDTFVSSDVGELRKNLFADLEHPEKAQMRTYQGKILLPRVLLIDSGVRGGFQADVGENCRASWQSFTPLEKPPLIPARVHYGDAECDSRGRIGIDEMLAEFSRPVTMYSWGDNYDYLHPNSVIWHPKWRGRNPFVVRKEYVYEPHQGFEGATADWSIFCFPDEVSMLKYLIKQISEREQPDIITGWNYTNFDIPYIVNRCRVLNEELSAEGSIRRIDVSRLSPACNLARDLGISSSNARVVAKINSHKGECYIPALETIDLEEVYKKYTAAEGKKESYTVDAIGWDVLKLKKRHYEGNIGQLWIDKPMEALMYNMRDWEICYFLDRKKKMLPQYDLYRREVGCTWRDVLYPATLLGTDQIRAANAKGIVLPTTYAVSKDEKKKKKKFKGAHVIDPIIGIHHRILCFDLKSLYLRLIDQWNISPDVYVKSEIAILHPERYIQTPNGMYWRMDEDGFTRERVRYYQDKRNEFRNLAAKLLKERGAEDPEYIDADDRQKAYKTFSLVFWGVFGHAGSELFWKPMAEAVTASGREVLLFTKERLESDDLKEAIFNFCGLDATVVVVYGDTDSNYASIDFHNEDANSDYDFIAKVADFISGWLGTQYPQVAAKWNCPESRMSIRCEKIASDYFMTLTEDEEAGKKCYSMKVVRILVQEMDNEVWKEVSIREEKGFETKRSDASKICREYQKQLFDIVLNEFYPEERHCFLALKRFILAKRKEYFATSRPLEDYAIPKGMSKSTDAYGKGKGGKKGKAQSQIRAAAYSNAVLNAGLFGGSKFYYVHVSSVPDIYPRTDVVAFQYANQLPAGFVVDYETMWEKQVVKKFNRVLRGLGLSVKEVLSGSRKAVATAWG